MNNNTFKFLKIRIQVNENFNIGPGKVALLESIVSNGSISSAARNLGMSYRKAWKLIKEINDASYKNIVVTNTGGKGIGGARVSEEGKKFIKSFRKIENKVFLEAEKEKKYLYKIFSNQVRI